MRNAIAALFLALANPVATWACPNPLPITVPESVTAPLVEWIAEHSPYPADHANPPAIFLCRTGEVISYEGEEIIVDAELRAAYDFLNDRIFLVSPWSHQDPRHLSSLLHELVHRAQFNARDWPCVGAAEPEAYRLQEKWLAERGVDAQFDWFEIYLNSRCPMDVHP
ncbi:DUF6647 family protein [Thioclava pacifica]|uniref:DUF6647 domain-containing protein n=1 Tax=Thioclava pacifica DSM 10166 TaxID=1353537 RepID=A0A074JPC2_9RHOB|nr:DUF6647 family protein [Thioclava pacifica]KEO51212.1 hypothetical protein TP2_12520 [Thioclava pacifica DSM 10166]